MEATLAERGQVVIPKAIRDQLGLTPGVLLTFAVEGGKLVIRKKVDDGISRARGIMKLPPGEDMDQWWRDIRGRAPNDPIEPWEELRDDIDIPARIREDHAQRRSQWLAEQSESARVTDNGSSLKPIKPKSIGNATKLASATVLAPEKSRRAPLTSTPASARKR
jgi:antitoxin PrlF